MKSGDKFLSVAHLELAGISNALNSETTKLFVRKEVLELFEKLDTIYKDFLKTDDNQIFNALIVQGSPGSGKSSVALAWIQQVFARCDTNTKLVGVWIHYGILLPLLMILIKEENSDQVTIKSTSMNDKDLYQLIYNNDKFPFLLDINPSIIIIDGVFEKHTEQQNFIKAILTKQRGKSVIVMVGFTWMKADFLAINKISIAIMYPWTLKQYKEACENEDFFESVKINFADVEVDNEIAAEGNRVLTIEEERQLLIDKKFYYAGSCARWMFGMNLKPLIVTIKKNIEQIPSYAQINNFDFGLSSTGAPPNHLVVQFANEDEPPNFTSNFVFSSVFRKLQASNMTLVFNIAKMYKNAALNGWLFEEYFISECRSRAINLDYEPQFIKRTPIKIEQKTVVTSSFKIIKDARIYDNDQREEKLTNLVNSIISDNSLVEIINKVVAGNWIEPDYKNQGGFDLSMLERSTASSEDSPCYNVHFYQLTIAKSHKLSFPDFSIHIKLLDLILEIDRRIKVLKHVTTSDQAPKIKGFSVTFVLPSTRVKLFEVKDSEIGVCNDLKSYNVGDSIHKWNMDNTFIKDNIRRAGFTTIDDSLFV